MAYVKAGLFRLHFNDCILVNKGIVMDGSYGAIGLPLKNFALDKVNVGLKNSNKEYLYKGTDLEWLNESQVFVRENVRYDGEDEPYIRIEPADPPEDGRRFDTSGSVFYINDPKQKMTVSAGFDNYFTDSYCIPEDRHTYTRFWQVYDMADNSKYILTLQKITEPDKKYTLNSPELSELRDFVQAGHDYFATIVDRENWHGTHDYQREMVNTFTFTVTDIQPIKIITQPSAAVDTVYYGVTGFNAKAENAKTARWYATSPTTGTQPYGEMITLDETGETSIIVNADGRDYFCRFSNGVDSVDTEAVYACFKPSFEAYSSEMTFIKGEDADITIKCDYDSAHPCAHIIKDEWIIFKNGMESILTNTETYSINGNTITLKNISSNRSFSLSRHIVTEHGSYYSPRVTINVVDGTPEKIITYFELTGIKNLCIGDKAPTIEDIVTKSDKYIVDGISWLGIDAQGFINSPNPSYTIVLKAVDGYSFKYDTYGYLKGSMEDMTLSSYGTSDSLKSTVTVTKTYDNHSPLTEPKDTTVLSEYDFTAKQYENVDIQLDADLICPEQHKEKHSIKSMKIPTYAPPYHLPEGLTMDETGHITGVVTMEPGIQSFFVEIESSCGDISTLTCTFTVNEHKHRYIKVTDPDTGEESLVCALAGYCGAEPIILPKEDHTHIWSNWKIVDDDVHSRECTECGEIMIARHHFDDGVITVEATEEKNGVIVYTCTECGYKLSEEFEYEESLTDDDFILGDVNDDGKINITDISKTAAHVKGKKMLDAAAQKRADTNGDGIINVTDVTKIAAHVKGKKLLKAKK